MNKESCSGYTINRKNIRQQKIHGIDNKNLHIELLSGKSKFPQTQNSLHPQISIGEYPWSPYTIQYLRDLDSNGILILLILSYQVPRRKIENLPPFGTFPYFYLIYFLQLRFLIGILTLCYNSAGYMIRVFLFYTSFHNFISILSDLIFISVTNIYA